LPEHGEQIRPLGIGAGSKDTRRENAKRTPAELEEVVMAIVRASPRPLGAYRIARQSRVLGVPLAPNQVYRILDRLGGRVHRVETLNAYFEAGGQPGAITICRGCGRTRTLDAGYETEVDRLCRAAGFRPSRVIVEVVGVCPDCGGK
jgi:Fur family zinc uptake transcriptional regulator